MNKERKASLTTNEQTIQSDYIHERFLKKHSEESGMTAKHFIVSLCN